MDTLLPSLLLVPWLKSLINWVIVTVQRHYMIRSFSGFFCISLALIDSFISFIITAVYYLEDFNISGWRLTRYHACLLVQISCFIYGVLHWPVFLLTVLDNVWTVSPIVAKTWQKLTYTTGVCLLWILATFYVFWVPDFVLLLGDDEQHCCLSSSSQTVQVLGALLLTVSCVILFSFTIRVKPRVQVCLHSIRGTQQSYSASLRLIMYIFVSTWAPFIVLMIIFPLLHNEMNGYLQMNAVWLCFLNSFAVALALCSRSFAFDWKNSKTVTDGFCSWSFCLICETCEIGNKGHIDAIELGKHTSPDGETTHIFLH